MEGGGGGPGGYNPMEGGGAPAPAYNPTGFGAYIPTSPAYVRTPTDQEMPSWMEDYRRSVRTAVLRSCAGFRTSEKPPKRPREPEEDPELKRQRILELLSDDPEFSGTIRAVD